MSLNNDGSLAQATAPANEVEGLRRLVEEQKKLIQAQAETQENLEKQIEKLEKQIKNQKERIEQLETELRAKKKLKGKPKMLASLLNLAEKKEPKEGKRAGSEKESKKEEFEVDQEITIYPESVPDNAKFNGYRDYDVQELIIQRNNIRFKIAEYITEDGKTLVGEIPKAYQGKHFGPGLICYVMHQHYQCRVPQPLIYEQLREWGIRISAGQVNRILTEEHEIFEQEQERVLRVGLETATYIHADDTGARHQGKNGYCTVIGNDFFAYFKSSDTKSRENFLEMLQGGEEKYVLNEYAQAYMEGYEIPKKHQEKITFSDEVIANSKEQWKIYLAGKGIVGKKTIRIVSEAALLGALSASGRIDGLRIMSDGAGQFNVLIHGLCWIHAERNLRKLEGKTKEQRKNIEKTQEELWNYYQELKDYQKEPSDERKVELEKKFDEIFGKSYEKHGSLNDVIKKIKSQKTELLQGLECPEFPLHNNAAERDIREHVTRRKISGGTRSEMGRKARDIFVGIKKTCRKLGVSFWNYLASRINQDEKVPDLSDVIKEKVAATQIPAPT
jgi:low affinity Fe/Cu permease